MTSSSASSSAPNQIDSVQLTPEGAPRFVVPGRLDHPDWALAAELETAGGVAAEVRVFLDEQLSTGDLMIDLAPGLGFVALSAATAPNGVPTVFVAGLDEAELTALQDAAADAGAWVEGMSSEPWAEIADALDSRLEPDGRVFVHAAASDITLVCDRLSALCASGRLLALCVSDVIDASHWSTIQSALHEAKLTGCELAEQDGAVVLVPLTEAPMSALIAVPASLFAAESSVTDVQDASDAATLRDDVEDAIFSVVPSSDAGTQTPLPSWNATHDGLYLSAPHTRTGYGVTGAHLLRALQARGVPVSFTPIGGVDRSITHNAALDLALQPPAPFRADAPSVRLAQAFDLAQHAGRGPRVGFTIFETDAFSDTELQHLRFQDAVLVCTPWAREVCYANGLSDRPVHIVPLGVDRDIYNEHVTPARTWTETVFLQVGKLEARKGQLELLRAFEAAFSPNDHVRLVLACHNPFVKKEAFDAALAPFRASSMAARITILCSELASSRDVAALMAAADCGVFPARAEGWNLEALEMLSMGKAVIATAATAHTAFLSSQNARLIAVDAMEPALGGSIAGHWPAWSAAQHEQLVEQLRAVHAERSSGALTINEAGLATARAHSWDASAAALLTALSHIA